MAPSTQPPDTLPTTSWPAVADTAIAAPGSRGALRYVRTTVARPKASPASHHLVILPRMSRTYVTSTVDDLLEGPTSRTVAAIPGGNTGPAGWLALPGASPSQPPEPPAKQR